MTAALVVGLLAAVVALGGAAGPALLHRLSPGLARRPRLGVALWASAASAWTLALLALGPLLAWTVRGPALPGTLGTTCQRCLEAASPFASAGLSSPVPTAVLLGAPVALGAALTVAALRRRRADSSQQDEAVLDAVASRRTVHGAEVWVLPAPEALAYATSSRVALSQGALDLLDDAQLAAVVAHEQAHLRDRHHLVLGWLRTLASLLGRVPLVREAAPAVASFAEMAADDAAVRAAGPRAVAGALLALGTGALATATPTPAGALHAGRHEPLSRARRLVTPGAPPSGRGLASAVVGLAALAAPTVLTVVPLATVGFGGVC